MRIALLTPDWRPTGGIATYVRLLAVTLSQAGHDVLVLHQGSDDADQPEGIAIRGIPRAFDFVTGPTSDTADGVVNAELSTFAPDVVHFHGTNNLPLEAAIRARYHAVKTLHTYEFCPSGTKYHHALDRACVHPTGWRCLPRQGYLRCTTRKRPSVWWQRYRETVALNQHHQGYRRLIVASSFVKHEAVRTGFNASSISVVPYFVPPAAPRPAATERTVLFVGRVVREKGADVLIEALSHLRTPWRCVIAGDGIDMPHVRSAAESRGVADRVEFPGWLTGDRLDDAFNRASVVVCPSRWPEPFGIVGLEAFARGLPVVAFRVGGIPEWLDDEVSGSLVDPLDARAFGQRIEWLLDHPDDATAMGARGRERVARDFSPAAHLAQLLPIYASDAAPVHA